MGPHLNVIGLEIVHRASLGKGNVVQPILICWNRIILPCSKVIDDKCAWGGMAHWQFAVEALESSAVGTNWGGMTDVQVAWEFTL